MAEKRFEEFSKTITNAAENVGKMTEAFVETQRIKSQMGSAQRAAQKSFQELGELVYKRYQEGEVVDEAVHTICEDISQFMIAAEEFRQQLAARKGKKICPTCQAEVDVESLYCMKCGSKIADEEMEEETTEDAVDAEFTHVEPEEEATEEQEEQEDQESVDYEEARAKEAEEGEE